MADFGSPVAQEVNPTGQGLQTLSGLLNIKQQQQTLATGQALQATARAKATVETQNAKENQALAQLLQDPVGNGIIDAKGNPTVDGQAKVMQVAPTTGASHYGDLVNAARTKIDFNTSVNNLNAQERQEVGSVISGAAAGAKSPEEVQAAVQSLLDSKQGTPVFDDYQKIADTAMHIVGHTAQAAPGAQPGQEPWRQAALGIGRQVLGAQGVVGAGGIATPTAGGVNTGAVQSQGTFAPALQGGGFTPATQVVNRPSPQVATLPSGSLGVVGGVSGVPSSAQPSQPQTKLQPLQRPSPNAPAADQQNYNAQIKAAGEHQGAISAAANDPMNGVQATRFRNQQILDLIPHANTGPYLKILNTLASRLPGSTGDAYQDIEHYTAQNSAALAKTMGVPGTNLGAETAAAAAGSVERNPGALAEITKTNDALNTALSLYNKGLAKATNNGSDPSRVNSYRQAFGQNLDINAVRWADAHRRNDEAEIKQLQDKYGKTGVAGFAKSLKVLKSLSENGDLP